VVSAGLGEAGALLAEVTTSRHAEHVDMDALARVQAKVEAAHAWSLDRKVEEIARSPATGWRRRVRRLSGGMKRRVLLAARAGVGAGPAAARRTHQPPRHRIDRLLEVLQNWNGRVVFVTHDRRFLRALATGIVEIDRGGS
jgi:ATP-binding cassette subfamily F protein uup